VLRRDGHRCRRCRKYGTKRNLELHHILPRSRGGRDTEDNLVTLCWRCHAWAHSGEANLQEIMLQEARRKTADGAAATAAAQ